MHPLAPSFMQKSNLSSLYTTVMGIPPSCFTIWIAIEPSPPEPPQTSTASPLRTTFGVQFVSIRYAVAPTSVGAAASSQVRCGAFGRHWCACTLVNCAKLPQLLSYPQILNEGSN